MLSQYYYKLETTVGIILVTSLHFLMFEQIHFQLFQANHHLNFFFFFLRHTLEEIDSFHREVRRFHIHSHVEPHVRSFTNPDEIVFKD